MTTLTSRSALVAALAAVPFLAASQVGPGEQVPRDRAEKAGDRAQLRQGSARQEEDAAQAAALKQLQASYSTAARAHDASTVAALDRQVVQVLDAEIAEGSREAQQGAAEQAQNRSESRSDRRETRSDAAVGGTGHRANLGDDAWDRTRDAANRADDAADLQAKQASLARAQQLRAAYAPLAGRVDDASLSSKSQMIGELVARADGELAANAREQKEDVHELREDRREKREDQRDRRW
jgi:hypothetical protein